MDANSQCKKLELDGVAGGPIKRGLFSLIRRPLERAFLLDQLNEFYASLDGAEDTASFIRNALERLDVSYEVRDADLTRIPDSGPLVVVANHPFGAVEGLVLAELILAVRPDVKLLANSVLQRIDPLQDLLIPVSPFRTANAQRSNIAGMRASMRWLRGRGALIVFPAGEVSHLDLRRRSVIDPPWSGTIARLIRLTGSDALPVYFEGSNGALFQLGGLLHARLRTAMLAGELLNKRGRRLDVRIGKVIPIRRLDLYPDDESSAEYLRKRTYLLSNRDPERCNDSPAVEPRLELVASPSPRASLMKEIERLRAGQTLLRQREFAVMCATAWQMPQVMMEIGRLREESFRAVGEGTGKSRDLDEFDAHYLHLFIWDFRNEEIVGAYRVARTGEVLDQLGRRGLYTSTLFHYGREFLHRLGPAIELGRAFVKQEYQRSFAPLYLLWKGIGRLVLEKPQYTTLFGALSISSSYTDASRRLIVEFLKSQSYAPKLAALIRPYNPFDAGPAPTGTPPRDIDELSDLVSELEGDGKGIPILLRQYLKLGARVAGFNIDRGFGDTLDALIVVDLRKVEPALLERIVGDIGVWRDGLSKRGIQVESPAVTS